MSLVFLSSLGKVLVATSDFASVLTSFLSYIRLFIILATTIRNIRVDCFCLLVSVLDTGFFIYSLKSESFKNFKVKFLNSMPLSVICMLLSFSSLIRSFDQVVKNKLF